MKNTAPDTVSILFVVVTMVVISVLLATSQVVEKFYSDTEFYHYISTWFVPVAVALFFHLIGRLLGLSVIGRCFLGIVIPVVLATTYLELTPPSYYVDWPVWLRVVRCLYVFGVSYLAVELGVHLLRLGKTVHRQRQNQEGHSTFSGDDE